MRRIGWQELPLVLLASTGDGEGRTEDLLARLLAKDRERPDASASRAEPDQSAPFVLATPGSLRSLMEQVLARAGIEPRVVAEADSLEVVKRLVQDGFGHALVPAACVTSEDRAAGLCAYPLPPDGPRLPVVLWLRDGSSTSPAVGNFLALAATG